MFKNQVFTLPQMIKIVKNTVFYNFKHQTCIPREKKTSNAAEGTAVHCICKLFYMGFK